MATLRKQKTKTNSSLTAKEQIIMSNYFRITGYYPKEDVCFIADSNGLYEKLWQFSAELVAKGVKVIAVNPDGKFLDGNITHATTDTERIILRACAKGQPKFENGVIEISGKSYTPNIR